MDGRSRSRRQLGCGTQVLDANSEAGGGGPERAPELRSSSPCPCPPPLPVVAQFPGGSRSCRRVAMVSEEEEGQIPKGRSRNTHQLAPPSLLPPFTSQPRVQPSQGVKEVEGAEGPGNESQDPSLAPQICWTWAPDPAGGLATPPPTPVRWPAGSFLPLCLRTPGMSSLTLQVPAPALSPLGPHPESLGAPPTSCTHTVMAVFLLMLSQGCEVLGIQLCLCIPVLAQTGAG